jgi:hypothetical protein
VNYELRASLAYFEQHPCYHITNLSSVSQHIGDPCCLLLMQSQCSDLFSAFQPHSKRPQCRCPFSIHLICLGGVASWSTPMRCLQGAYRPLANLIVYVSEWRIKYFCSLALWLPTPHQRLSGGPWPAAHSHILPYRWSYFDSHLDHSIQNPSVCEKMFFCLTVWPRSRAFAFLFQLAWAQSCTWSKKFA